MLLNHLDQTIEDTIGSVKDIIYLIVKHDINIIFIPTETCFPLCITFRANFFWLLGFLVFSVSYFLPIKMSFCYYPSIQGWFLCLGLRRKKWWIPMGRHSLSLQNSSLCWWKPWQRAKMASLVWVAHFLKNIAAGDIRWGPSFSQQFCESSHSINWSLFWSRAVIKKEA